MLDPAPCRAHASDLPSMMATLNSYEAMFGPYHFQTLALTVQIARALWSEGETRMAQHVSEQCVTCMARGGHQGGTLRMSALTILRDLLLDLGEQEKAIAVQKEIVGCLDADDPRLTNEKADLARMLLSAAQHVVAA